MSRQFIEVVWDAQVKKLICYLPVTQPTGRVRVKRNRKPVATRQTTLQPDDLVEWQISYHDQRGNPVELGKLLSLAYEHGLLSEEEMTGLQTFIAQQEQFFEENFTVLRERVEREFMGFEVWWQKHPLLRRTIEDGEAIIEVEWRHRQKAVGYQAMVFLMVPLKFCEPSDLIGRKARAKEMALWSPSVEVLVALVRAFAIASRQHRDDIETLLTSFIHPSKTYRRQGG